MLRHEIIEFILERIHRGWQIEAHALYLMGPVATEDLSFSQNHAYRKRHQITEQKYWIPYLPPVRALTGLSLAYYMVTGKHPIPMKTWNCGCFPPYPMCNFYCRHCGLE